MSSQLVIVPSTDVEVVGRHDLATLADEIHQQMERGRDALGDAVESYFAIGRCLGQARELMPSDNDFGDWFKTQEFGFTQQWARVLRSAAELEGPVREAVQTQVCTGQQPNIKKAVNEARAALTEPVEPRDPSQPRRNPLPKQSSDAAWALRKAVERLERIFADDRFSANKEQVAAHSHGHLSYVIEVCQDLLDQLNNQKELMS